VQGLARKTACGIALFQAKIEIPYKIEEIQRREANREVHLVQKRPFLPDSFLTRGEHRSEPNETTGKLVINS
jgi:hypothetical protein